MANSSGMSTQSSTSKPNLSNISIWNMSLGFLGIQMGFALQNGNARRILMNFGADVHELLWFWLVAPLTGMIVQPRHCIDLGSVRVCVLNTCGMRVWHGCSFCFRW